MKDLLIGLDQGTTGTTVLVVDRDLKVQGRATAPFPQHFPEPGWVEHDPAEVWASVLEALAEATADLDPARFAALGITNQRETTFVWDAASGEAVGRAIVWQDRRTTEACLALKPHEAEVRAATGLPLDPYFSATKLKWILDRHPGRRLAFGTADAWLLNRLTGHHATDPSNASRTQLFDLRSGAWSEDLQRRFGLPAVDLPQVRPSTGDFGTVRGVPGLPEGLPVRGIAGDQQAALFGQGCHRPGQAKLTYGTGSFVLLNTGSQRVASTRGLLTTVAWRLGGASTFALEGGAFVAGALVQWLRDGLGIIESSADVEALARSVPDAGGVTVVPALAGLGAPHWRPEARGLIHGITRGTTSAHLARAALEGIAHAQADILEAMAEELGGPLTELRVDGGAAANDLLMQLQADLLGIPLLRPKLLETTALGAALLAGLGVGLFPDLAALEGAYPLDRRFEPQGDPIAVAGARNRWRETVAKA
ncbi:MAG TPA: glycerol kinase GlpK [Holophagaceae bacterium]|nr:glycerol kinase GlpK [Holophagaceae bacterium]